MVVKKGDFKVGDLGVYIQPDSVVPQTSPFSFIWESYVGLDGTVPEKRRRITVRKFRGEWSEGLLLPVSDFGDNFYVVTIEGIGVKLYGQDSTQYDVGDDVSDLIGITHYDPDKGKENQGDNVQIRKAHRWPRSLKGLYYFILYKVFGYNPSGAKIQGWDTEDGYNFPVYDVEALKNYSGVFAEDETIMVTEKIHGSNGRFVFLDDHMYAGSRTQWKKEGSNCIWRDVLKEEPWIQEFCEANPGVVLYGEVTPTQGDKFKYTEKPGFHVFDILLADGTWLDSTTDIKTLPKNELIKFVPALYFGPFGEIPWKSLLEGPSILSPRTVRLREGVVVKPFKERHVHGLGRAILKVVSNQFLEKDSK